MIVNAHTPVPEHPEAEPVPVHPAKLNPALGVAAQVTGVPLATLPAVQFGPLTEPFVAVMERVGFDPVAVTVTLPKVNEE